ncbi:MAG: hypothetical protein A2150_03620 [Candidatus Muproteobacteria bacterium RBG_16_64_11]|uniref:Uncharacterized protein n=1 Tax=Candidatus Muproteobacteria bacterium RBG_16_64_11 TaxID=1817758 RepID=A0A1F6TCA7_9PROT|nr:MAG: hypothetical protein A2150_03620 [Candidatus Muproteobacteria bacterium RBG_16_64_11]
MWTTFKFALMFAAVAWFVSRHFGAAIGFSAAAIITALSVAHRHAFDAASDAFLGVDEADGTRAKTEKVAVAVLKRTLYSVLDYGMAALSILLVVAMKESGFSYGAALAAMWLVIDLPSAAVLVTVYEKTGRDLTLGRSYRRMANEIFARSKLAGAVVFGYETTLASFWSGPDYTVLFFRDELKTRTRLVIALVILTALHAVLWTTVYWMGYEDIQEYFLGRTSGPAVSG